MSWNISKVYCDPGFSGAYLERPALNELREDIKAGKVDAVLVWKLDRLSRSQKDTLFLIEDEFLKNGVEFISTLENFDTSSPFGRAMIGILSVFAQLEREQIRERMQLGLDARAKTGKWHGGGFDPFGYDYVDGELIVNEEEARIVRKVYSLFLEKAWSVTKIKRYLSERYKTKYGSFDSDSTVVNILTNPIYISKIRWKSELYDAPHASIITEEQFSAVQKYRQEHAWQPKDGRQKKSPFLPSYLLSGLLYCGNCGARYFVKGNYSGRGENKKYYPYYTCYSRGKTDKKYVVDPTCKNPSFHTQELDNFIIDEVKKLSLNPDEVLKLLAEQVSDKDCSLEKQQEELRKIIKAEEEQIKRLIELCKVGGAIPIQNIAQEIEKVQKDIDKNQRALETLKEDQAEQAINIEEVKSQFLNAAPVIDSGDYDEIRSLIRSLISRIEVTPEGDVRIHWNFNKPEA